MPKLSQIWESTFKYSIPEKVLLSSKKSFFVIPLPLLSQRHYYEKKNILVTFRFSVFTVYFEEISHFVLVFIVFCEEVQAGWDTTLTTPALWQKNDFLFPCYTHYARTLQKNILYFTITFTWEKEICYWICWLLPQEVQWGVPTRYLYDKAILLSGTSGESYTLY